MDILNTIDSLQEKIIEDKQKKNLKPKYNFDKLKMYFGEDCEIAGIQIKQPKIGDILRLGESKFYRALSPFLCNPTSIRLFLWERNIDWNKIKDIEVFAFLMPSISIECKEVLDLVFSGVDFKDFILFKKDQEFLLYSQAQNILLSEFEYLEIAEYLREIMNVHPKVEKAKTKSTKNWMIQEERMNLANKTSEDSSTLLSLVSACVNHPGFKYKLEELKDIGIYQFMDSVKRLQKYESTKALLQGNYSGFADFSKVNKELFNFMGDV